MDGLKGILLIFNPLIQARYRKVKGTPPPPLQRVSVARSHLVSDGLYFVTVRFSFFAKSGLLQLHFQLGERPKMARAMSDE